MIDTVPENHKELTRSPEKRAAGGARIRGGGHGRTLQDARRCADTPSPAWPAPHTEPCAGPYTLPQTFVRSHWSAMPRRRCPSRTSVRSTAVYLAFRANNPLGDVVLAYARTRLIRGSVFADLLCARHPHLEATIALRGGIKPQHAPRPGPPRSRVHPRPSSSKAMVQIKALHDDQKRGVTRRAVTDIARGEDGEPYARRALLDEPRARITVHLRACALLPTSEPTRASEQLCISHTTACVQVRSHEGQPGRFFHDVCRTARCWQHM